MYAPSGFCLMSSDLPPSRASLSRGNERQRADVRGEPKILKFPHNGQA